MLSNYFSIALRFMFKHTGFTVINVFGLTVGIACSLLIFLYVEDELSFDKFHPDAARTYRLGFQGKLQGKKTVSVQTGSPVAKGIAREAPEVESVLRLANWATFPVRYEDKAATEKYMLLADSNFFRFFNFELVAGHPDSVLHGPSKIVISESAARRYLGYKGDGDTSPIGKTLMLAQGYPARISGIAKDAPLNSHFHFTLILSLDTWEELRTSSWITRKVITYVKLKPGASAADVAGKFNAVLEKNLDQELKRQGQTDLKQFRSQGNELGFFVQPLLDVHLTSHYSDEIETNGSIQFIYLFSSIAVFILLLASINFMNLSTARGASRAKEVGVRKVVGAHFGIIVKQFLLESYCYVSVATILGFFLVLLLLLPFNYYTGKDLSLFTFSSPYFILAVVTLFTAMGLLAGSYPAFYLTRFNPMEVLRGTRARTRSYGIRNMLVVFQFFISTGLIIATIVVFQQLRYLQRADIGFDKGNIVNLLHTKNLEKNGAAFKKELLEQDEILSASYANRLPPNMDWQAMFKPVGTEKDFMLAVYEMDYDHLSTMGYSMVSGRYFSRDVPADSLSVILNESAARKLGLVDFRGKKIFTNYDAEGREREVIGIIKDFNFQSLKNSIQPLAIILGYEPNWEMAIRISDNDTDATLQTIRSIWKKHAPGAAFEYTFLDKNFETKHEAEKRLSQLFILFTILAIILACLGLFGLATFSAEQRTKEIGIRKVLGATVSDLGIMLNKDFLRLVLLANLIAWPFAVWAMNAWLRQFAYHISMKAWFFALTGFITLVIALISVSFRALKAARGNPVRSLRND